MTGQQALRLIEVLHQLARCRHAMTRQAHEDGLGMYEATQVMYEQLLELAIVATEDTQVAMDLLQRALEAAGDHEHRGLPRVPARREPASPCHLVISQHDQQVVRVMVPPSESPTDVLLWLQRRRTGTHRYHFVARADVLIKREGLDRQIPGINGTPTRTGGAA